MLHDLDVPGSTECWQAPETHFVDFQGSWSPSILEISWKYPSNPGNILEIPLKSWKYPQILEIPLNSWKYPGNTPQILEIPLKSWKYPSIRLFHILEIPIKSHCQQMPFSVETGTSKA